MGLLLFAFISGPVVLAAYWVAGDAAGLLAVGWVAVIVIWFLLLVLGGGMEPDRSRSRRVRPERRMAQEDEYNLPSVNPPWSETAQASYSQPVYSQVERVPQPVYRQPARRTAPTLDVSISDKTQRIPTGLEQRPAPQIITGRVVVRQLPTPQASLPALPVRSGSKAEARRRQ